MEGLKWGENCSLVPVAYGIKKIIMTAVISQTISMDEIIEIIQSKVMRKGLRKMYEVYDEDRSGAISADEFIDYLLEPHRPS